MNENILSINYNHDYSIRFFKRCSIALTVNNATNWNWIIYHCHHPSDIDHYVINFHQITCTFPHSIYPIYESINAKHPVQKIWLERIQQVLWVMKHFSLISQLEINSYNIISNSKQFINLIKLLVLTVFIIWSSLPFSSFSFSISISFHCNFQQWANFQFQMLSWNPWNLII